MVKRYKFSAWPTFFTTVGICLLLALGSWQAGRYLERVESDALLIQRQALPPLEVRTLAQLGSPEKAHYRNVHLVGRYDHQRSMLFKFRNFKSRRGMWLVTPFILEDGAILVNRGWVPHEDAQSLASAIPEAVDGELRLTGLVTVLDRVIPDEVIKLEGADPLVREVVEFNTFDLNRVRDALPHTMPQEPVVVVLTENESTAEYPLADSAQIVQPYLTAEKHLGYSVTWYLLALGLLMLYLAASFGYLGGRTNR